jgi:hypothetical protein
VAHDLVLIVARIHHPAELELLEVAHATDGVRLGFGLAQCGQKHRRQNGDDGDHHQQFDEGKSPQGEMLNLQF